MGVFKKLKDDFTAAARRFAAVAAFAGSSLLFPLDAAAQTQTAPANNNGAKTEQTFKKPHRLNREQREKINAALLKQAQDRFIAILPSVEDGYSCQLQDLQQELNARLQENNKNPDARVIVLDPIQMDVGLSLGFWSGDVARQMLWAQGVKPDAILVYNVMEALTGVPYVSAGNDTTYTQFPMTLRQPLQDSLIGALRIIVPSSGYAPAFLIPGLSLQETIELVNRHEGWHAIERRNRYAGIDYSKLNPDSLQTIKQKIGNTDYLKHSCALYNGESFADVGAVGDMIRNGQPPGLIDKLIAARMAGKNHDVSHMSPPSLRELKKRIGEMGIEKFRALADSQAAQLYGDIVATAGLTPERLTFVYKYVGCAPEKRMDFVVENQCDPDFIAAFNYINSFVTEDVAGGPGQIHKKGTDISLLLGVLNIGGALQSWDASAALQKRAFALDGRITPQSYAKAYGTLMNELGSLPENSNVADLLLADAKIVRLKNTFLGLVQATDYVRANKAYGVDILALEPSLLQALQKNKAPEFKLPKIPSRHP